ncbi:MAG: class I tRNA ligase family protein [Candidatus Peribacteria bacterium]|jgi:hypothetical protein|nr:class I tRNA ligase family protein [Candidatus Peribacteria bacterium]
MHINWAEMEKKRQTKRESEHIYHTSEDPQKEKFYVLDMFPYPSGAGLHVGHPKGYIATDTLARKKMLEGFSVLHPMGFDTFGLGTEQYAIDNKMKPQDVAKTNIDNFKKQLAKMGFSYDWERSFSTADPDYYRRTQRIFLQLYTHYYDEEKKQARPLYELLKKRLLEIYDIATIKKEYKSGRSKDNPTYGQCIPTALLVQSLFGGEVYKLEQDNHYYNVINGEIVDLTKDQFNYELDYTVGIKRTMIFDEEALQRYELLKEKL